MASPRGGHGAASAHRAGLRGLRPIPPPFPIRGRERGVASAAAGNGPPGTAARAYKRSTPTPERTPKHAGRAPPPEGPGKFPLDKLSTVVVQLSARGRIGSGVIRCPPASARESRSGKSPEGFISLPGFYSTPTAHQRDSSPHPMRLTQQNLHILLRSSCRSLMCRYAKHPRLGVFPLGFGLSEGWIWRCFFYWVLGFIKP